MKHDLCKANEYLDVKEDVVFQRILGKIGNERIIKPFLEKIVKTQIDGITLDTNKRLIGNFVEEKVGRLDVKAKLSDGTNIFVEMQNSSYRYMPERILYYWAEVYASGLARGDDYISLNKTIAILITTENLSITKHIDHYHTIWNISERLHHDTKLTSHLEIHIIELSKFKEDKSNPENDWIKFLKGGTMENLKNYEEFDKDVQEAIKELEMLEDDPEVRELVLARRKALRDYISFTSDAKRVAQEERKSRTAWKNGRAERQNRTVEQKVWQNGIEKNTKDIVLNMYNKNFEIKEICDIVNLPEDKVKEIINEDKK